MNDLTIVPRSHANPDAADPYEVLGIAKDASAAQIRKAYRRAAQEFHPDKHGNSEEAKARFQAIQGAYETLSDFAAREFFDATGKKYPSTSELAKMAEECASQAFAAHIQAASNAENVTPERFAYVNLMDNVVKHVHSAREGLLKGVEKRQQAIAKLEQMLKRFSHKDRDFSTTPVYKSIKAKLDEDKEKSAQERLNAEVHAQAVFVIEGYSYTPDEVPFDPLSVARTNEHGFTTRTFMSGGLSNEDIANLFRNANGGMRG